MHDANWFLLVSCMEKSLHNIDIVQQVNEDSGNVYSAYQI